MADKKVLVGTVRKDGSGTPAHGDWTTGDTLVDPDGNPIGGSGNNTPTIDELKGATIVASGTTLGTTTITLEDLSAGAIRFYLPSCGVVLIGGATSGYVHTEVEHHTDTTYPNRARQYVNCVSNPSGALRFYYICYRVDET